MQQQQFINIIKKLQQLEFSHLAELEVLVKEYPFFETAHLLYTKGLHKYQAINYSKQLRKSAIVVNSRNVLYELLHQVEPLPVIESEKVELPKVDLVEEILKLDPNASIIRGNNKRLHKQLAELRRVKFGEE